VKRRPTRQESLREKLGTSASALLPLPADAVPLRPVGRSLGEGVAKHKCGSCHFFQEAGLAGSGWCHHPQRKVSSGVLIMVRRNELACRDEWSRSLWQPRDAAHTNGDLPFQRPAPGPLPPALAENLRSVLNHDTALAASAQGEDVLLSEARIVSEAHESWEPQPRPFPVGNFDPRTAIFRAREAYRERARAKATADRQSAGAEAITGSEATEDVPSISPDNFAREPEDFVAHEADVTSAFDEFPARSPSAESWSNDSIEAEPLLATPVIPASGESSEEQVSAGPALTAFEPNLEETLAEWLSSPASGEQTELLGTSRPATEVADPAQLRIEAAEREAIPDWYRTDLPRICRTCRDYRPAADGQRGWCANSWAFTHRRLVHEDDPAPCQSAIGDWWLPVDDVWLVAADVSSHGRATPLLDRLTGKAEQQRRRS
jgi:hypothetical protein